MTLCSSIELRRHSENQPWTYAQLNQRQQQLAQAIQEKGVPGAFLISEVAPVVTVGRRTPASDLLMSRALLQAQGVEVLETDRGGLATYHGPGQWVFFPVERLDRLTGDRRGVRLAVEGLLQTAANTAQLHGLEVSIREGAQLGVWSKRGKLASVGVRIQEGILLHGLSLNVYRTPQSFLGIRPCGLSSAVDFLFQEKPDDSRFLQVKDSLVETAQKIFLNTAF